MFMIIAPSLENLLEGKISEGVSITRRPLVAQQTPRPAHSTTHGATLGNCVEEMGRAVEYYGEEHEAV